MGAQIKVGDKTEGCLLLRALSCKSCLQKHDFMIEGQSHSSSYQSSQGSLSSLGCGDVRHMWASSVIAEDKGWEGEGVPGIGLLLVL